MGKLQPLSHGASSTGSGGSGGGDGLGGVLAIVVVRAEVCGTMPVVSLVSICWSSADSGASHGVYML